MSQIDNSFFLNTTTSGPSKVYESTSLRVPISFVRLRTVRDLLLISPMYC